ncbi:PLP-dependent cysteine synthase family protein [Zafaria sp. J156]|uniref:PLP-dependent cysteine synthase family protein n=1 Tax=Zafaria sp. J156 TaxID=3116490 RepID=UPI002E7A7AB9|nr:PLP-dependent cysteine synthase family protein [Zafaria sp. J156]MEE1622204.1 PLP-dependent cysteine synthase family protein [Zafaria sp. J156]
MRGREWVDEAVRVIEAENNRSADTHLHRLPLPGHWGVQLYLKDESTHRTGSLKHRLARSLFLYGLVNGWITESTPIVEASSGSTAVSEAYYAQLLGLDFTAVMARGTSAEKIALIERFGGRCLLVKDASEVYARAEAVAADSGGHYMDQFTYAERATDWRGNNNIAESLLGQLAREPHPVPEWIVAGAGTGGTSATIGRYLRYHRLPTRLAVADPEGSAFAPAWDAWRSGKGAAAAAAATGRASRIEGIGRPRMEPSFIPSVIDEMRTVPDGASVAAMNHLARFAHLEAGPSTGTNLWLAWQLAAEMVATGRTGSIVTLLCDGAERYRGTHRDPAWLAGQGIDPAPYDGMIDRFLESGRWDGAPDGG